MESLIDNKKLWDNALNEIELTISKASFGTWFKHTHIIKNEDGVVFISVPNAFVKDWLSNKYHKFIIKALRELDSEIRSIEYVIIKIDDHSKPKDDDTSIKTAHPNDLGLKDLNRLGERSLLKYHHLLV